MNSLSLSLSLSLSRIQEMGTQAYSPSPQILCRLHQNKPKQPPPFYSTKPNPKTQLITLSSSTTTTTFNKPKTTTYNVEFNTLGACSLGISKYPDFTYNAEGGQGSGIGEEGTTNNGEICVDFDVGKLYIPPLTSGTTRFLGLPLPPFLRIDIVPMVFRGSVNRESGKVELEFKARFLFLVGSIYKAPPLMVETVLTSDESKGMIRGGRGQRLDEAGRCRLVGVATVEPINDFLMNSFLGLPTECLANLNALISFSSKDLQM